ncbi:hypothetical protein HETIRDRAFT_324808 [Heterobasidion irregulare TC 32-1]|uniref:Uncharacterized protein n=1 Tax=Heterobasidion irregulare (strain TC 32-1) TaxID=747525 RepID=W4JY90_HETIT|nr:uncharacterized protein HETIRDRAFT_324808 [Heterobasidion irregulare TC 32-1]ETW78547.1 hypothetical protein HETIRDRAFT_324808 [Heterobasidion irregulare TC 32-1]
MKCGRTDPSAAECPLVACCWSGKNRPCSVKVGIFGTCRVLFSISPKLPEYLPQTLAWVHAHQRGVFSMLAEVLVCTSLVLVCFLFQMVHVV